MKSSIIISSLALALPAFAAPAATTSAKPIATPQNQCQVDYNNCLAIGTPEVMCSCDMTACFGEDAARIREWCASKTSTLTSGTATATATAAPSATATDCVAKDNACRASDPVTGLSANQAQCSADNAACKGACEESYNTCRTTRGSDGLSANQAQCASEYAGCLGENPFDKRSAPAGAFGGVAIHSGSEIQYASINAAESKFFLLKDSSVYCPNISGLACPNTTSTQFIGGDNTLSLETIVPGGQQVFVAVDGSLSFTAPHSAYTGPDAMSTGFSIAQEGEHVQFQGEDWLACPIDGHYAIYAAAIAKDASACTGFAFRVADSELPAAWEYS
jgi:hypothetical protein